MQQLNTHKPAATPCPEMLFLMSNEAEHVALEDTHAHVLTMHRHMSGHTDQHGAHSIQTNANSSNGLTLFIFLAA